VGLNHPGFAAQMNIIDGLLRRWIADELSAKNPQKKTFFSLFVSFQPDW
jgi:hypothetical protein